MGGWRSLEKEVGAVIKYVGTNLMAARDRHLCTGLKRGSMTHLYQCSTENFIIILSDPCQTLTMSD